jgi:hypothetical protein
MNGAAHYALTGEDDASDHDVFEALRRRRVDIRLR